MKDPTCEKVLIAMMAAADGESAELSPEDMKEHLSACEGCRAEAVRMQQVSDIFLQATRRESTIDLWPSINSRLVTRVSTDGLASICRRWGAAAGLQAL